MTSMAVVTKGPVATAGSIFILANPIGTNEPTSAATDIEEITASATDMAKASLLFLSSVNLRAVYYNMHTWPLLYQ